MHVFVVPPLQGPPTGGTLYNRQLIDALRRAGQSPAVVEVEQILDASGADRWVVSGSTLWVDTLYLDHIRGVVEAVGFRATLGLLTHYLPSFVAQARRPAFDRLSPSEAFALRQAERFLVPSAYLRDQLVGYGISDDRVVIIEPGFGAPRVQRPRATRSVNMVLVANVVVGKGVLPLLEGLAAHADPGDDFELSIVGGLTFDREYADQCRRVADRANLRGKVCWLGSLPHSQCLERMAASDLLVSASRMESYGMAVAEARACGLPVVARLGGNVANLVDPAWGGETLADEGAVAKACLSLVRRRSELQRRKRCAAGNPRSRSWDIAAREFLATSVLASP